MAITFIVTKIDDEGQFLNVFGQLLFSNNPTSYTTGGDGAITVVLDKGSAGVLGSTANSAGMSVFLSGQTGIRATRPPFEWNIQMESGFNPVLVPGTGPLNFKIKLFDPSTKAEIGAGAYNAAITAAVFNTLLLKLKKAI